MLHKRLHLLLTDRSAPHLLEHILEDLAEAFEVDLGLGAERVLEGDILRRGCLHVWQHSREGEQAQWSQGGGVDGRVHELSEGAKEEPEVGAL